MANNPVKLWIPSQELDVLGKKMPLSSIDEVMGGCLVTAVLANPGYLGPIGKTHILVYTGHFMTKYNEIAGAYGHITKKQRHSMYSQGLMFTTYNEADVQFHLGTRTVTKRYGIDRIEVPEEDLGKNLHQFVLDAYKRYDLLGLKHTERENHLLFYMPINAP